MPNTMDLMAAAHNSALAMTEEALARPRVAIETPTLAMIEARIDELQALLRRAAGSWPHDREKVRLAANALADWQDDYVTALQPEAEG